MDESILDSIKKPLGLEVDYDEFDVDLIMLINGSLMTLSQNGVGKKGFRIDSEEQKWSEFLGDFTDVESAKTYVYLETRMLFDPPSTSAVLDAFSKQADEYLWRCREEVEIIRSFSSDDDTPDFSGIYYGDYVVIPKVESQKLYTEGLLMEDDVEVKEIPISTVDNASGGQTSTIGGV